MDPFDAYEAIEVSTSWGSITDKAVWPWWAFVKEKWVRRPAELMVEVEPDYKLNQRRKLVKEWMDAGQEFRDRYITQTAHLTSTEAVSLQQGYATRGPHESSDRSYLPPKYPLILTIPLDRTPTLSLAWSRFIFLTRFDSMGTCWDEPADHYIPATGTPQIDPTTFPISYLPFISPNFHLLGFTSSGKPYIYRHISQFVSIENLHEGSKLLIEYASDGNIARSKKVIGVFSKNDDNSVCALGQGWFDVFEEMEEWRERDKVDLFDEERGGIVEVVRSAAEVMGVSVDEDEVLEKVRAMAPELL